MMHITMKHVAIENGYAEPILHITRNFWFSGDRLIGSKDRRYGSL